MRPYIDRALKLARCLLGIGHRQRSKARETVGMRVDGLVESLIGVARHRDRDFFAETLRARPAERQHLHIDAGFVHVAQPLVAEI